MKAVELSDLNDTQRALLDAAADSMRHSYNPYSRFSVGAAILADGQIVTGANVENASYGLTICAERVALTRALSMGLRKFEALAVTASSRVTPCGACRQMLSEAAPDILVLMSTADRKDVMVSRMSILLPFAFNAKQD